MKIWPPGRAGTARCCVLSRARIHEYGHSLRPCLARAQHTPATRRHSERSSKLRSMAQEVEAGTRTTSVTLTFGDRVAEAVDRKRSQLLVGLDPRPELLPVELRGDEIGRAHV